MLIRTMELKMRRKGEQPPIRFLDAWSDVHPVARTIATGNDWFYAWLSQKCTPFPLLARRSGLDPARIRAISAGDRVSRAEIDALARAWSVSAGDLIASMPDKNRLVE